MTPLQNKIGSVDPQRKTKRHTGFSTARWIVTVLYVLTLVGALLYSMNQYTSGLSFPLVTLALTASYAILMLLLWLYERFPPPEG